MCSNPGQTRTTRTKCDPVDPDDLTRLQRWLKSLSYLVLEGLISCKGIPPIPPRHASFIKLKLGSHIPIVPQASLDGAWPCSCTYIMLKDINT